MMSAIRTIRHDPLAFLTTTWRRYGDVVQFPIPRPPTYLVNDPASVRQVLVGNARNYGKSTIQYQALALVTGEGLLSADTPRWRRQRPMVQPAFHHETLDAVVGTVADTAGGVAAEWSALRPSVVIDADAYMMHAALEVVGRSLFGSDLSGDAARITAATLSGLEVVIKRARVPVTPPRWVPTPANRTLARARAALDDAVARILAERTRTGQGAGDMLDLLIAARDDRGVGLTPQEIRDEIVTFIVAGHETVASALAWSWLFLAQHPEMQDRIAEEARAARPWSRASIAKLPFTRAIFDETMRLYPPAWVITRRARDADHLPCDVSIPAGALVIISPYLLHRHPDVWSDPEEFRPERFLEPYERDAFIPFGAGPRLCIGRDFAYVEGVLMLAMLMESFRVDPTSEHLPWADPQVTIRPQGGAPVRITRR
jgi:cytochrome P450